LQASIWLLLISNRDCKPASGFCSAAIAIAGQHLAFAHQESRLQASIWLLLISNRDCKPAFGFC